MIISLVVVVFIIVVVVIIQVSDLCIIQRPTTISVFLFILTDGTTLLNKAVDITLPQNNELNSITVNNVIAVLEDIEYNIIISYSNIAGDFNNNGSVNLSK